ncbi:hypothetical protein A8926_0291 [Saccharopolyspora spinosa]|uniref:Uncharacterized protein n=1 Tax=Saccharopolyspora spinosa TaxID=60894 RepID=A0A2N3XQ84_SACSN|nr:hypothetical protein A8926_0291 [Saccharopolyspora spinosa]
MLAAPDAPAPADSATADSATALRPTPVMREGHLRPTCRLTIPVEGALRSTDLGGHSHSMVPGGLEVTSRVTRLTSATSLVIRVEIRSSTS